LFAAIFPQSLSRSADLLLLSYQQDCFAVGDIRDGKKLLMGAQLFHIGRQEGEDPNVGASSNLVMHLFMLFLFTFDLVKHHGV